ncbi:MAG: class I adenylate-forming enzyme family protein, partial [Acidimicrobiales bacterium]
MGAGLSVPRLPSSAADVLERPLAAEPGREALVASDARLSYAELDAAADRAASALHALGVGRGDVVAISVPNTSDVVITFHAVMRMGGIWLGVNRNLAPPEKRHILEDAGARLLLADDDIAADSGGRAPTPVIGVPTEWRSIVAESDGRYPRARPAPSDPAGIAYSSGTTGRPKGVVHSHRNVVLPGAVLVETRRLGPDLRKGDCAALTILNMQVTSTLLAAQAGGTQILIDRLDPAGIAEWVRRESITTWFGVPTLLHGLAGAADVTAAELRSLTDVWTGGTYLPESVRGAFEAKFGIRVSATYGLTEVPTIVTMASRSDADVAGSSGSPLPHLLVEIRDDAGDVLPAGQVGEITVRAREDGAWSGVYQPMLGYVGQVSATTAAVRNGVLYTGDIGRFDPGGRLFVTDRKHAVILRGGANVYPAEVERVLMELAGVRGAAVVAVADERLGQRVVAAVE